MRRQDVAVGVIAGLVVGMVGIIWSSSTPIFRFIIAPALAFWWVGAAATVAAWLLRGRARPMLSRILGIAGIAWITIVLGTYGLFVLVFLLNPMSP